MADVISLARRRTYQEELRKERDCQQELDAATLNERRDGVMNSLEAAMRHAYKRLGMSANGAVQMVHHKVHQEHLKK